MFSDPALAMLKMMGYGTAVSGAILIADVAAVLKRLAEAVCKHGDAHTAAH